MDNNREVPIEIVNRHGHISPRMEDYAVRKAERLLKFNSRISRIEIIVDGPHEEPSVEMIVHADRQENLVAKDQSEHFGTAVDRITDKMERQLVKAKEKRISHKADARGAAPAGAEPDAGSTDEETYEQAVRRRLEG